MNKQDQAAAVPAPKLITNKDELTKAIDVWGRKGSGWVKDGIMLSISVLTVLAEHGDIGPVNRLYKAMPKGTKTSAMVSWLLTHGAIKANTDSATKADMPFIYSKDKKTNLLAASQDPWFDHKPEPKPDQVFDIQKALMSILARAKATKGTLTHAELLTPIQAALSMLQPNVAAVTEGASADGVDPEDDDQAEEALEQVSAAPKLRKVPKVVAQAPAAVQ